MAKLPSGFFDHPSKMGWRLCPELNLKLNGSIWALEPWGAPSKRTRVAADPSQREETDMTAEPFRWDGLLREMCADRSFPGALPGSRPRQSPLKALVSAIAAADQSRCSS